MIHVTKETVWNGPAVKIQAKSMVSATVWDIAFWIESQAKLLCARRYGYLAASINTQMKGKGTNLDSPSKYKTETPPAGHNVGSFQKIASPTEENTAYVGTAVDYSLWVEFGTVKMDAQPFLRPALDLAQGKILEIGTYNGKAYFKDYLT